MVNPRQTTAIVFPTSVLNTPEHEAWAGGATVGATLPTCPVEIRDGNRAAAGYVSDLAGLRPTVFLFGDHGEAVAAHLNGHEVDIVPIVATPDSSVTGRHIVDTAGRARAVLGADGPSPGILVRPDGHIAARWQRFDGARFEAALDRSLGVGDQV